MCASSAAGHSCFTGISGDAREPAPYASGVTVQLPGELVPFGWDDRVLALFEGARELDGGAADGAGAEPGRVVRVERSACVVVFPDGDERIVPTNAPPAVGDWVVVAGGLLRDILPRWSAVTRLDPSGEGDQVLAANVDLVLITAPADRLSAGRIERELTIAWDSGAQPLVVLTKADLVDEDEVAALNERLVGVDLLRTSTKTGEGVDAVRAALQPHRTAVLFGPSGAGKSTLANALLGEERLATGEVREGDSRGRHTTTSRQMAVIPTGGVLIDTPGLRSLGLTGDGDGLERVFSEIEELAGQCRFSDCGHEVEPGCAIRAAIDSGDLDPARLASYRKLDRELAAVARKDDPEAQREQKARWKAITKSMRGIEFKRTR